MIPPLVKIGHRASLTGSYGTPILVVGEYVLNSGAIPDHEYYVGEPRHRTFGGLTPPATSTGHALTMAFNMSDLGGLVFIDRPGNGASGGVGTNYIANLIIGSTWSYVTGGPEFTNQPPAITSVNLGGTGSLSGAATAADQSVSYYWQKYVGGTWQTLTDGTGTAGGTATISGANTATLNLAGAGVSAGDTGNYQLVATASGTTFTWRARPPTCVLSDPRITANPANTTANYGGSATFTATATTASAPLTYQWYDGANALGNGTQPDGSFNHRRHRNHRCRHFIHFDSDAVGASLTRTLAATTLNVINNSSFNSIPPPQRSPSTTL